MFFQALGIAFGAGLASAILFALSAKGTVLAALLAALAPLPIMLAALGWTHWAGLLAALLGALSLSLALPAPLAIAFAVGLALPGWRLAQLALVADPALEAAAPAEGERRWYPISLIAGWAVGVGVAVATAWIGSLMWATGLGADGAVAAAAAKLAPALEKLVGPGRLPQGVSVETVAEAMIRFTPPAAAASCVAMLLVNLWAAGRATLLSGRLPRPWPDVAAEFALPKAMLGLLPLGLVLAFLSGLPGLIGWAMASAAFMAFTLQGLAAAHVLTRGWPQRRSALFALYAILFFVPWLAPLVGLFGVAEQLFGLRARRAAAPPPSTND